MESKILIVSAIVIVIAISVFVAKKKQREEVPESRFIANDTIKDGPVAFGYKMVWFAVKTDDQQAVADVLNIKNAQQSNWQSGIEQAYKNAVFITPPIEGWILAAGRGLPQGDSKESLAEVKNLANCLSNRFGEAQFFGSHRVVEYQCWLKSVNGSVERVYAYIGEQGENIEVFGTPTAAESGYNFINTLSVEAQDEAYFEREDLDYPDEELVMQIAGKWSVDPTLIENNKNIKGLGLLGKIK